MTRLHSNLQIGNRIGAGSFGEVFLGTCEINGNVAVKVIKQAIGEPSLFWDSRKRDLLKEGKRLSQATHTNVVRVFSVLESQSGDAIHLVMENCAGGSLQVDFDKGPMRLDKVRDIATSVAFGLQALHARGMLHRDIKPGNLLLTEKKVVKLGDFGLVTDNLILGYGSQAGYSDHIAPEVWADGVTSERSDIWALGMTIYRLLHGAEWYSRLPDNPRDIIPDGGFADTLRWLPHIPQKWRRFVRMMLVDDPHDRVQNANQVVTELARLPIEPRWECAVTSDEVRWEKRDKSRRTLVVWKKHSARTFTWRAWSEPVGKGNQRSLGESKEKIGYAQSDAQLRALFNKLA